MHLPAAPAKSPAERSASPLAPGLAAALPAASPCRLYFHASTRARLLPSSPSHAAQQLQHDGGPVRGTWRRAPQLASPGAGTLPGIRRSTRAGLSLRPRLVAQGAVVATVHPRWPRQHRPSTAPGLLPSASARRHPRHHIRPCPATLHPAGPSPLPAASTESAVLMLMRVVKLLLI